MPNTYSIVLHPSEDIISKIKMMKETLSEKIGWFNSKNSLAHITIGEFTATDIQLENIKKQLAKIGDSIQPLKVVLDHFGSYPNGAFFIAPNPNSKEELIPIMKRFHQEIRFPIVHKSTDPHLSIARKLSAENLEMAFRMFPNIELEYRCEDVVLRRFDAAVKQFKILAHFPFKGNIKQEFIQTSLF
jgi:2'-5' RNA ligase